MSIYWVNPVDRSYYPFKTSCTGHFPYIPQITASPNKALGLRTKSTACKRSWFFTAENSMENDSLTIKGLRSLNLLIVKIIEMIKRFYPTIPVRPARSFIEKWFLQIDGSMDKVMHSLNPFQIQIPK
jgi:hypothetical protein